MLLLLVALYFVACRIGSDDHHEISQRDIAVIDLLLDQSIEAFFFVRLVHHRLLLPRSASALSRPDDLAC